MEVVFSTGATDAVAVMRAVFNLIQGQSWSHMWHVHAPLGLYLLLSMFKVFVASETRDDLRTMIQVLSVFTLVMPRLIRLRVLQYAAGCAYVFDLLSVAGLVCIFISTAYPGNHYGRLYMRGEYGSDKMCVHYSFGV